MFYHRKILVNYPIYLHNFQDKPDLEKEKVFLQNIIEDLAQEEALNADTKFIQHVNNQLKDDASLDTIYEQLMQGMYDTTEGVSATKNLGGSLGGMAIPASLGIALTFISCTLGSISWN